MTQAEALAILDSGQSALLTGAAGSGKTFVLNEFIRRARLDGKKVAVTATTGLAATHLDGTTVHAWSGIGVRDELPPGFVQQLPKSRRETILTTDVLVIDEISMLHDFRLDMIDQLARSVREEERPFGGLQVVLCGDFFQLPPVNRAYGGRSGGFVTGSGAWQETDWAVCYLHEQHRQDADGEFAELLEAIRGGDIEPNQLLRLQTRLGAALEGQGEPTRLHTTNADVDAINLRQLHSLDGEAKTFQMFTTGKAQYVEQLTRSCLAPAELHLKPDALVMCIKNSPDRKYVNGSLGIVQKFDPDTGYPIVKLHNGRTITIVPESWELVDGDKKRASLQQLPLRLAWAITVHKSQGMTLDAAHVDLSRAFVEGMGYVALSRVRNLDTLSLAGLNQMALKVSAEALSLDQELQARSEGARHRFADTIRRAAERPLKVEQPKPAVTTKAPWSERLDEMRQRYPNAFKPWSRSDDDTLKTLYESKSTIDQLSTRFGRHPGSIRSRLRKHYGDELFAA